MNRFFKYLVVTLCFLLILFSLYNSIAWRDYEPARDKRTEQAVETLNRYGALIYHEHTDVYQYRTVWEITSEEIHALHILSRNNEIILYTN